MQHEQLKDFQVTQKISNKKFGIQLSIIFLLIFLTRLYFNYFNFLEYSLITLSLLFFVIAYLKPALLKMLKVLFLGLGEFIFKIINPVIMLILYIFLFLPFGLALKMLNYDPLKEKNNKNTNSYWSVKKENYKKNFKNQF